MFDLLSARFSVRVRVLGSPFQVLCSALLWLMATPPSAEAQKQQFFDALLPLYKATAGAYGDEGEQITRQVEAMMQALGQWDGAIRASEAERRARLGGADARTALQIHTLLASMYLERSRFTEALREFDVDIKIDPARAAFHRFRALIFQTLDRRAEAADAFRTAWLTDPADPENAYHLLVHKSARTTAAERARARDTLASLERELVRGQRAKAEAPFLDVRAITDDAGGAMAFAPAAYAPAFSLLLRGDLDSGLKALGDAVVKDPLVADSALRLEPTVRGMAALRQGRIVEAIDAMKAALAQAPASAELPRILAAIELINGDIASSVQHLRDSVRLNAKNERAWLALARTLDDLGEWVEAANVVRRALTELPDSGELRWQLSVISGKRQRTDDSDLELIATADRLVLLAGTGELYGRIARLAQAHLNYPRAIELLEKRVSLAPNNDAAHQALGLAYVEQGREEEGYAELVIALLLNPADADTLAAIGRLHLTAGRFGAAIEALTRAVTSEPANAQSVHALGDALVRAGKGSEGQQHLQESERLQSRAVEGQRRSRTAGMLTLQAEISMSQQRYENAIELWRQAAQLETQNVATRLRLAAALVAAQRLEEAATELRAAISLQAGPDARLKLADVYAALGRIDDSARERRIYSEERLRELRERAEGNH